MSDIKFAVGMSKRWDSKEAGREAAINAIKGLGEEPRFMLIFCTIHYTKNKNGFQSKHQE